MKGKKRFIITLLVVLLVVSLTGCGGDKPQTDGKVNIVMWHTLADQHEEALLKIIDGFNASQDKYVMVAEQQPYSEIDAKLMQSTRNGTGPDISSLWPTDAAQYIKDGLLVDFSQFINDPTIGIENFKERLSLGLYEEITQWGSEQVYLFPISGTGEVLFYNKTLFDELGLEAPKTWSDVEAYSKTIYEKKGIPGFGTDSAVDTYLCLIRQAGSSYIDGEKAVINMDRNIAINKLNWFADGVKDGYFRLVGEDMYFSNPFGSGAVASYIGSSAGVSYVFAAVGDAFEVGCVPIPQEGVEKYISSWGSGYAGFSKDEEKAKGVFEYLKYSIQQDVLLEWAEQFGSVPYYLDLLETDRFQAFAQTNIAIKALAEEMAYGGYLPSVVGTAVVRIRMDEMIQNVAMGNATAEAAFDAFVEAANAEMSK